MPAWRVCLAGTLLLVGAAAPALAAGAYAPELLWAVGQQWKKVRVAIGAERHLHQQTLRKIEADASLAPEAKKALVTRECVRHRQTDMELARARQEVQNVVMNEANARVRGGKTRASAPVKQTYGTSIDDPNFRGTASDFDAGAGSRTTEAVKEVLLDMGIDLEGTVKAPDGTVKTVPGTKIKETATTLEVGDEFEFTVNKAGLKPKPGTDFHRTMVEAAAGNPETYLSEMGDGMIHRDAQGLRIGNQAGADAVAVHDNRLKAAKGLQSNAADLAADKAAMQKLAKGTRRALEHGGLDTPDNATTKKILKQNGITDTPEEFINKLEQVKGQKLDITDPVEAEKIRKASRDLFEAAEGNAMNRAKQEIVALREKAAALPPDSPERIQIEDEIADSVAKIKASKNVTDSTFGRKATVEAHPGKPVAPEDSWLKLKPFQGKIFGKQFTPEGLERIERAGKAFGVLMFTADVGVCSQALEDYCAGKTTLKSCVGKVTRVVAGNLTLGWSGVAEKGVTSYGDYQDAANKINDANRTNLTAFLNRWEIELRKGGVDAGEARRLVASAIETGSYADLEQRAAVLQAQGKPITPPRLIVETFEADEGIGTRALEAGEGMVRGIGEGVGYIITAPYRAVTAWGEGELAEAEIEEYIAGKNADRRKRLYQQLRRAGIDSKLALRALNLDEDGASDLLRKVFKQARKNMQARRELMAKLAKQQADAEAELLATVAAAEQYNSAVGYLRWMPLEMTSAPKPVVLTERYPDKTVPIQLAILYPRHRSIEELRSAIRTATAKLTGEPADVSVTFFFRAKGKPGKRPNVWQTEVPATPNTYGTSGGLTVRVSGAKLTGPYSALATEFTRPCATGIPVKRDAPIPNGLYRGTIVARARVRVDAPGPAKDQPSIKAATQGTVEMTVQDGKVAGKMSLDAAQNIAPGAAAPKIGIQMKVNGTFTGPLDYDTRIFQATLTMKQTFTKLNIPGAKGPGSAGFDPRALNNLPPQVVRRRYYFQMQPNGELHVHDAENNTPARVETEMVWIMRRVGDAPSK